MQTVLYKLHSHMPGYRAFITEDDDNYHYKLSYYHNPQRWNDNLLSPENPIRDIANWSDEIKYLNDANNDISDTIKQLPTNVGGIYMFYIKGINLPFIENYVLYIGRCKYTDNQNIRKRASEYYTDKRDLIRQMFKRWKNYLYYRYYADTNNETIVRNEIQLIRAILPEYNESIPDRLEVRATVPAFH